MKRLRNLSTSSLSTGAECQQVCSARALHDATRIQFEPETMFSSVWALEPPVRLRASYSAAGFADARIASYSLVSKD